MWDGEMARTVRAGLTPKKDLPREIIMIRFKCMFRKMLCACFGLAATTAFALAVVSGATPTAWGRGIARDCSSCNPACAEGWHCCTTANGYCGCFLNGISCN